MSKPKILIYANVYDTTVGQGIPYMNFFSKFGDVILISSEMDLEYWISQGDILALPGGMDMLSSKYGISPGWFSKNVNAHYEYLDENLLVPWLDTGKPIIGICRGMQVLNVYCGGTLHRHVEGHVQDDNKYWRYDRPDEMFTDFQKAPIYMINSFHHQAVRKVAPGFDVLGWSWAESDCPSLSSSEFSNHSFVKEKGRNTPVKSTHKYPMIPEIMKHSERPYIAFQYHPEEFNDTLAISLINNTLKDYAENTKKTSKEKPAATAGQKSYLG